MSTKPMARVIKYYADDISVVPKDLGTLDLSNSNTVCITVAGSVEGAADFVDLTFDFSLGSSFDMPKVGGEVASNAEFQIKHALKGPSSSTVAPYVVTGYSELAIVSVAVSQGKVAGTVYIEAL